MKPVFVCMCMKKNTRTEAKQTKKKETIASSRIVRGSKIHVRGEINSDKGIDRKTTSKIANSLNPRRRKTKPKE